ncbi:MAG: hypothetical protein JWO38_3558 [Gemmataceae bacterium]|nr:hypothetical protein [Gemmataceae bacterium]
MARVRLSVRRIGSTPFFQPGDRSGVPSVIPLSRLLARLSVIPRDAAADYRPSHLDDPWCPLVILDTGSPLTLFPYPVWQPFEAAITWLEQPPRPDGQPRRVTILGGSWVYRLGRVRAGLIDEEGRWLPAVWANAWFLEDAPASPRQAVLGLRTGVLDGRSLRQIRPADGGPAE